MWGSALVLTLLLLIHTSLALNESHVIFQMFVDFEFYWLFECHHNGFYLFLYSLFCSCAFCINNSVSISILWKGGV